MNAWLLASLILVQSLTAQLPTGVVSGRLFNKDGIPAAGIRVAALVAPDERMLAEGTSILSSVAETDSSGRYRLENLPPGRYLIQAGFVDVPGYFPGVSAISRAAAVTVVSGGLLTNIDFATAGLSVSGRLTRAGKPYVLTSSAIAVVSLVGGPSPQQQLRLQANVQHDGSFNFEGVPPGAYRLQTTGSGISTVMAAIDVVDRDVTGLETAVSLINQISGTINVDGGAPSPPITLRFTNGTRAIAVVGQSGYLVNSTFRVTVPEGEYRVAVDTPPGPFFLKSVVAGGADLTVDPIKVSEGVPPPTIEVTLGVAPPVAFSGRVDVPSGMLHPTRLSLLHRTLPGNSVEAPMGDGGSFEFPRITPGSYFVSFTPASDLGDLGINSTISVPAGGLTDAVIRATFKEVSGRATVEGGGTPPAFSLLLGGALRAQNPLAPQMQVLGITIKVNPRPDGSFRVVLPEGDYRIGVDTSPNALPVGYRVTSLNDSSSQPFVTSLSVAADNPAEILVVFSR